MNLPLIQNKRILLAPLDWGLGHATRCIPIVRELIEKGNSVVIAAEGKAKALLEQEFPNVTFIDVKGYRVSYSDRWGMTTAIFFQIPKILMRIIQEHFWLSKAIDENKFDVIISDNRYGLCSGKAKSIFITHQLNIKTPFFEGLVNALNHWFVRKYAQCWIPDYADCSLTGDLSRNKSKLKNVVYIEPLSRFKAKETQSTTFKYAALAIVSGPEPYRSIFERQMLEEFLKLQKPCIILQGKPEESKSTQVGLVEIIPHALTALFQQYIEESEVVYARSGYSTIMDLHALKKDRVHYYPTPGQTEQEYLALLHKGL